MVAASGIHQLSGDPQFVVGLPHAALQQERHPQIAPYVLHLCCLSFVGEGGGTGDDKHSRKSGESSDEVICNAVAKILLVAVVAHVGEGQYGNRGFVTKGKRAWHIIDADRWGRRTQ